MKFKKIQTKMLATILPVIVLAFLLLTVVATESSKQLANQQMDETMFATRDQNMAIINADLEEVRVLAEAIASTVQNTYTKMSLSEYEKYISGIIEKHPMVNGSGIWFEPYVYNADEQYH